MYELFLTLLVCVSTWLGLREIRKAKRKRKVVKSYVPLVQQLFGVSFHTWLCMKLWPDKVPEEILLTVTTEGKKTTTKTEPYYLSPSGLWIPAR